MDAQSRDKDLAEGKRLSRLAGTYTDDLIEQAGAHIANSTGQGTGESRNPLAGHPVTPAEIEQTDFEEQQRSEQEDRYEGREAHRRTLEKRMGAVKWTAQKALN